jgi:AcrR family transcriptional regulator
MQPNQVAPGAADGSDAEPGGSIGADRPAELDTRERLVRAAIDVFLEKGYGGTRVQDIAKRAGYTAGALYVHFPSRTALLGEAIMLEGRQIIASIVDSLAALTPGEGRVSESLTDVVLSDPTPFDVLMLEALALASREQEAREMLSSTLSELETAMTSQIERARELGLVDPDLDVTAIRAFLASWILGMIVHRAIGLTSPDQQRALEVSTRVIESLAPHG